MQTKPSKKYQVTITRQDEAHALAETRGHELKLNIKKGNGAAGFNAAETLLAALGACLLTNVNAIGEKMRLQIDDAHIKFEAERRDEPPVLKKITYRLVLESPDPQEKLQELHDLSFKWGTVTSTLVIGLFPEGKLVIKNPSKVE